MNDSTIFMLWILDSTETKLQHQIHGDLRFSQKICVIKEEKGNLSQPNSSQ